MRLEYGRRDLTVEPLSPIRIQGMRSLSHGIFPRWQQGACVDQISRPSSQAWQRPVSAIKHLVHNDLYAPALIGYSRLKRDSR